MLTFLPRVLHSYVFRIVCHLNPGSVKSNEVSYIKVVIYATARDNDNGTVHDPQRGLCLTLVIDGVRTASSSEFDAIGTKLSARRSRERKRERERGGGRGRRWVPLGGLFVFIDLGSTTSEQPATKFLAETTTSQYAAPAATSTGEEVRLLRSSVSSNRCGHR